VRPLYARATVAYMGQIISYTGTNRGIRGLPGDSRLQLIGAKKMTQIEIYSGLSRLEFSNKGRPSPGTESDAVLVEFVLPQPLPQEECVCVPLGRRGFQVRELSGKPTLIATEMCGDGSRQYRYRIAGPIQLRAA
jgi:hypothetical protein